NPAAHLRKTAGPEQRRGRCRSPSRIKRYKAIAMIVVQWPECLQLRLTFPLPTPIISNPNEMSSFSSKYFSVSYLRIGGGAVCLTGTDSLVDAESRSDLTDCQ